MGDRGGSPEEEVSELTELDAHRRERVLRA